MFAYRVAISRQCSLIGLDFFERLTFLTARFRALAARKVANWNKGLPGITRCFCGRRLKCTGIGRKALKTRWISGFTPSVGADSRPPAQGSSAGLLAGCA